MHTHRHSHAHAHTQARPHPPRRERTHAQHTHARARVRTGRHTHTHTHAHSHARTQAHAPAVAVVDVTVWNASCRLSESSSAASLHRARTNANARKWNACLPVRIAQNKLHVGAGHGAGGYRAHKPGATPHRWGWLPRVGEPLVVGDGRAVGGCVRRRHLEHHHARHLPHARKHVSRTYAARTWMQPRAFLSWRAYPRRGHTRIPGLGMRCTQACA